MKRALFIAYFLLAFAACATDGDDPPAPTEPEPDPLEVTTTPEPGSLDDLHGKIIAKRCSGQPGLCHNGQFEPNLSTPGLTYAYLVNRPGIEKPTMLRVAPGNAGASLFIDKIRNRNGVATQMPLGAEPLSEEDTAALEKWINDGALRAPGAAPAPVLNNPPRRPQIGIFNGNTRLDGTGPIIANVGQTLTLRHTVQDFETLDGSIPFGAIILSIADGRNVVVTTGNDPHVGPTTFQATGAPPANGDTFNWFRTWQIPAQLTVRDDAGNTAVVNASGQTISVLAIYIDGAPMSGGMLALEASTATIGIQ